VDGFAAKAVLCQAKKIDNSSPHRRPVVICYFPNVRPRVYMQLTFSFDGCKRVLRHIVGALQERDLQRELISTPIEERKIPFQARVEGMVRVQAQTQRCGKTPATKERA
jgi:hypothetical protein